MINGVSMCDNTNMCFGAKVSIRCGNNRLQSVFSDAQINEIAKAVEKKTSAIKGEMTVSIGERKQDCVDFKNGKYDDGIVGQFVNIPNTVSEFTEKLVAMAKLFKTRMIKYEQVNRYNNIICDINAKTEKETAEKVSKLNLFAPRTFGESGAPDIIDLL